jgi:phosphopantothenoylcysteine decarboxylase/phosphopantothenate--cysteine ligase
MWAHPATRGERARSARAASASSGRIGRAMAEPESGHRAPRGSPRRSSRVIPHGLRHRPRSPGGTSSSSSGPTQEAIDPVRYIANRAAAAGPYAIAAALAALGARVTLVTGPVAVPDPPGVAPDRVESAREMLAAVEAALPADAAVFAAAVADFRPDSAPAQKIKKEPGAPPPEIRLRSTPTSSRPSPATRRIARAW